MRGTMPEARAVWLIVLLSVLGANPARAEELRIEGCQVYETDPTRLGTHNQNPALYKVRVTAKDDALWIEGADLNYEWLTIVPYTGVSQITMNRSRQNPYDPGTQGGWLGRWRIDLLCSRNRAAEK